MVPSNDGSQSSQYLVRKITAQKGFGQVKFNFQPKPNYAMGTVNATLLDNSISLKLDGGYLNLHLPKHTTVTKSDNNYEVTVTLQSSSSIELILEYDSHRPSARQLPTSLEETTKEFWKDWVGRGTFFDFCRDRLVRSAITLKLLQFSPTGAMVAAPTTSLPEEIGGQTNR